MSDLVRQRELAHFGRHAAVVVDKRDDSSVERPFGALVDAADCLRVCLVLLADAARGAASAGYPREACGGRSILLQHNDWKWVRHEISSSSG